MNRRCASVSSVASVMAKTVSLDLPYATVLANPRADWNRVAFGSTRNRVAHQIKVDWKKFNSDDYLFTHTTIVSSVDTESNGYTIKHACNDLVNSNGNSWTNEVLLATFRTFVGGENYLEHCFPSGTRVLMADGTYKEIQDIRAGDVVINRLGVPDVVKNTQRRNTDSLVKISSPDILSRDLFVTENHPFWVYHARETCPKTGRPNGFDRDSDFGNLKSWAGFSVGVHKRAGEVFECGVKPEWKNAGDIDANRDFITHPVSELEIPNVEINESRAELIGWFLAEGSYSHVNISSEDDSGVVFNLGNGEYDVAERIRSLLIKEFGEGFRSGCEPRIYETESGSITVCLCNKKVAEFFFRWCGKYSWGKKLHADAVWLPKKLQALILKHCINGDGSGEGESRGYIMEMKAEKLVQQLLFISWRLGLNPCFRNTGVIPRYTDMEIVDGYEVYTDPETGKKSRPGYVLTFSVRDSKKLNEFVGHTDDRIASRKSMSYSHVFETGEGKWIVSKIGTISREKVSCDVFNIEVENDNSYIAEGVVVHNCQIPELSKGKILDALIRPLEYTDGKGNKANVYYVDLLIATERRHEDLVGQILSGEMNTLSMGCLADFVTCSKCGKVLGDNETNCYHLEHELGAKYADKNGIIRVVSEECGRTILDKNGKRVGDPKSVKFIEASWVKHPAFGGAVLNHFVSELPKEANAMLGWNTGRLELAMDDIFKLRVADKNGMMILNVAKAEITRRRREDRLWKISNRLI